MAHSPSPLSSIKIHLLHWLEFGIGILITIAALIGIGYWAWQAFGTETSAFLTKNDPNNSTPQSHAGSSAALPGVGGAQILLDGLHRDVDFHTMIPTRSPDWIVPYTIQKGDTVNAIAAQFGLKPASLVWGNPEVLAEDANMLRPGQSINILPVDGAFYQWKTGDTLKEIADQWHTSEDAIVSWPGNAINPLQPVIYPTQWLILPGGWKPFEWEAPMIRNGTSSTFALGAGACLNGYSGPPGDDAWVWPARNHYLSGTDYMPPVHPGIDVAIYMGMPIMASNNGVIVYAGWSQNRDGTPGYGNLVIIDHLNGFHTFYGHLLQINVSCGQKVFKGEVIGLGGSTGNSTGPHLHFEMRYDGYPQNPWGLLPPS
jgi:murein DD-endopeptidase MepM/ murein hydrolase activator NlpD